MHTLFCVPEEGRAVHASDVEPQVSEPAPRLASLIAPMRRQRWVPWPRAAPGPIGIIHALPMAKEDNMLLMPWMLAQWGSSGCWGERGGAADATDAFSAH